MPIEIQHLALSPRDRHTIKKLLDRVGTDEPTFEQMWRCMDAVWDELGCDNRNLNSKKIEAFYRHPVWLLTGLWIEQQPECLGCREIIADWTANRGARRIADLGGGFGTLARMIATKCQNVEVDIVEPFPQQLAIEKSVGLSNISYKKSLSGSYDIIIALDVFEHLDDPLRTVHETAVHLKLGGIYLTGNCFYPIIKCHLPATFHFRHSWNVAMKAMGFEYIENVSYGSAFLKTSNTSLAMARVVEAGSRIAFPVLEAWGTVRPRLRLRTRFRSVRAYFANKRQSSRNRVQGSVANERGFFYLSPSRWLYRRRRSR
jgi:SAM-dependent methyltransferase